jgi:ribosomal protein S12 methylthiotransferase accessory factor
LDGTRDREEIAGLLPGYTQDSVLAFLGLLERTGLIEQVADEPVVTERWRGQIEFFRKWTDQPEEAMHKIQSARLLLVGMEPWGVGAAAELASAGVGAMHLLDDALVTADDVQSTRVWQTQHVGLARREGLRQLLGASAPWCQITAEPLVLDENRQLTLTDVHWDLIIAAVPGDDLSVLRAVAAWSHRAGLPSLHGHLAGLEAVLGPAVVPGKTACWNCTRLRLLANSDIPEAAHALQASLLQARPQARLRTYLAPMPPLLGQLLAAEALKLISGYTPSQLRGRLLIHNLVNLEASYHAVIRLPWCDVCGSPGEDAELTGGAVFEAPHQAPKTQRGKKKLTDLDSPEELRAALAGWVDERTGIVRYLHLNVADDREPTVPLTCTALLSNYTEGNYHPQEPFLSSGKGLTRVEAMIGAVGEAIERYSAARYRIDSLTRAAMHELPGDSMDPRLLGLYEDSQYDLPDFPYARFKPTQPIHWTRGNWLDTGEPVWLPALPTYFNFHPPRNELYCQVSSNGLAAGTDLIDAALRATLELVERDAFMLTWHCRLSGRRIIPNDSLDPGVAEIIRQLEAHGAQIELYLLSAGIDIPVVACFGIGDGQRWPGVTVALAAHPSLRSAVRKAILEQGAVGPYIRRMMLDGQPIPQTPGDVRSLNDHALFYVPIERRQILGFLRENDSATMRLADLAEPIQVPVNWYTERLAAAGVRVAVADVTSPDIAGSPFRVVRALGVNMQPIDFNFKLRRLTNPRLQKLLTGAPNPYPHPLA